MNNELIKYTKDIYIPKLSKMEIDYIYHYTYRDFDSINDDLRTNQSNSKSVIIDNSLSKFEYDKPIIVYRKINVNDREIDRFINLIKRGFIIDRAFQSTSINIDGYKMPYNVLIEILVDKLNSGAYIDPISYYKENEFLLRPNSKIEIEDYTRSTNLIRIKGKIR